MSDNPQSERDTNQASEELREQWSEQLEERLDDISTMGRTHMKREVMNLIRTEKLKLLAEVRKRVIGEDVECDGTCNDGSCGAKQRLIDFQRQQLTKLEADL